MNVDLTLAKMEELVWIRLVHIHVFVHVTMKACSVTKILMSAIQLNRVVSMIASNSASTT
jgi:hypothetical protein